MSLRRLATHYGVEQDPIIEHLSKMSGIVDTAAVIASSNGRFHKFRKYSSLPTASVRAIGDSFTDQSVQYTNEQISLKSVGITVSEDAEECEEVGVEQYFNEDLPAHVEAVTQAMVAGIIYGTNPSYGNAANNLGWLQYAQAYDKSTAIGGTSGTTSIWVVKMVPRRSCILLNRKLLEQGKLLSVEVLNDGKKVLEYTGSGTKKPVYQALIYTNFGWLTSMEYSVHHIYGVDTSNAPTDQQLKAAVRSVHGKSYDTFIYTSPFGSDVMDSLNITDFSSRNNDGGRNTKIKTYDEIPIVVDDNIRSNETVANFGY
jgi:hypothetical protein